MKTSKVGMPSTSNRRLIQKRWIWAERNLGLIFFIFWNFWHKIESHLLNFHPPCLKLLFWHDRTIFFLKRLIEHRFSGAFSSYQLFDYNPKSSKNSKKLLKKVTGTKMHRLKNPCVQSVRVLSTFIGLLKTLQVS